MPVDRLCTKAVYRIAMNMRSEPAIVKRKNFIVA